MKKLVKQISSVFGPGLGIRLLLVPAFLLPGMLSGQAAEPTQEVSRILDLETVVKAAQLNDPWLVGNKHSEDAVLSMSVAAGSLPDPTMSVSLANLPTNSFNFGQEAMTQAKVGISQSFPPGDSLNIRKRQLELKGSQYPYQRQDRKAKIAVTVAQLWLNAYKAQESIALVEKNRALFEQLADVAQSSYSSALGKSRQQDVVRAQLELTRLEDRLTVLRQRQEMYQERLSEWLNGYFLDRYADTQGLDYQRQTPRFTLMRKLPEIKLLKSQFYRSPDQISPEILYENLSGHPALKVLEQKIKTTSAGIDLAKQKYKPKWGVNAGYGYRASDVTGNNRSDLFSVGVTFSIPLFTANRQDKEVQSAMSRTSAVKTEKWQLARKLMASFETAKARLLRLNERQKLYETQLLPQIHDQAEASLTAYTNDDGDFAEVVRARIAQLDAEVDALSIDVERQKTIIQLNYFFMTNVDEIIASNDRSGEKK